MTEKRRLSDMLPVTAPVSHSPFQGSPAHHSAFIRSVRIPWKKEISWSCPDFYKTTEKRFRSILRKWNRSVSAPPPAIHRRQASVPGRARTRCRRTTSAGPPLRATHHLPSRPQAHFQKNKTTKLNCLLLGVLFYDSQFMYQVAK